MAPSPEGLLHTAGENKEAHEHNEELFRISRSSASRKSAMYSIFRYAGAIQRTSPSHTEQLPGVYLTDLTFIEDGIPATIKKSDLINFAKRAKTADVIREIQTYQNVAYPFKTVPELLEMMIPVINESPDASDQDTYDLSLKLEPREREDEKIAR